MSWTDIEVRVKKLPKWAQAHIEQLETAARVKTIPVTIIFLDEMGREVPVATNVLALPRAGEHLIFEDTDREVRYEGRAMKPKHYDLDGEIGVRIPTKRL